MKMLPAIGEIENKEDGRRSKIVGHRDKKIRRTSVHDDTSGYG